MLSYCYCHKAAGGDGRDVVDNILLLCSGSFQDAWSMCGLYSVCLVSFTWFRNLSFGFLTLGKIYLSSSGKAER